MGLEMFDAARSIMKAGISAKNESELRILLLKRLYVHDLDPVCLEAVIQRMQAETDDSHRDAEKSKRRALKHQGQAPGDR